MSRPDFKSQDVIQTWIITTIAKYSNLKPSDIDPKATFSDYGLDSMKSVTLIGDIETWLGRDLSPTLPWDYPTIENLAIHLSGQSKGSHRKSFCHQPSVQAHPKKLLEEGKRAGVSVYPSTRGQSI